MLAKLRLFYARCYILYKHAEAAICTEQITSVHVKLTAVVSLFNLTIVGIMAWFKWTEIHFQHTPWSDVLVLLIGIPFFWFGLWCAWKSGNDGLRMQAKQGG